MAVEQEPAAVLVVRQAVERLVFLELVALFQAVPDPTLTCSSFSVPQTCFQNHRHHTPFDKLAWQLQSENQCVFQTHWYMTDPRYPVVV